MLRTDAHAPEDRRGDRHGLRHRGLAGLRGLDAPKEQEEVRVTRRPYGTRPSPGTRARLPFERHARDQSSRPRYQGLHMPHVIKRYGFLYVSASSLQGPSETSRVRAAEQVRTVSRRELPLGHLAHAPRRPPGPHRRHLQESGRPVRRRDARARPGSSDGAPSEGPLRSDSSRVDGRREERRPSTARGPSDSREPLSPGRGGARRDGPLYV